MCRVFPTSLKGEALSWFTKFHPNFVDSFAMLISKFETHFATSRLHHLTYITLVGIHQEKEESLRTFIDRFGKVAMSISNLSSNVVMHYMLTALHPGPEAWYMQLEELKEFRNQARAEASEKKRKEEKERHGRSTNWGDRRRDNRGSQFSRYTLLTAERERILDEALSAELIPLPRKTSSLKNVDHRKWCRYHKNSGHPLKNVKPLRIR